MNIAVELGLSSNAALDSSRLAGFTITMLTGGQLIVVACIIGLLLAQVLPRRWFHPAGATKGIV